MPLPPTTQTRLETQLDSLFLMIAGLSPAQLQESNDNGKWSILQNMAHLARYQEVFIQRMDRIQLEELPGLPAYRAEQDPGWLIWQEADHHVVSSHLKEKRKELNLLIKGYSPKSIETIGVPPAIWGHECTTVDRILFTTRGTSSLYHLQEEAGRLKKGNDQLSFPFFKISF